VVQVAGDRLDVIDFQGGDLTWLWGIDEFGILHISDQAGVDSTYVPA
jgi:hypothetical protein